MATTIQITQDLQKELAKYKISDRETYEEIIWDLLEDRMTLSAQTVKDIARAREQIAKGNSVTLDEVKKRYNM